jgi:hypothetical protein
MLKIQCHNYTLKRNNWFTSTGDYWKTVLMIIKFVKIIKKERTTVY